MPSCGVLLLFTRFGALWNNFFDYDIIHIGKAEAALAGLIALFPVLIVFLAAQRLIVRGGATVGSVEG